MRLIMSDLSPLINTSAGHAASVPAQSTCPSSAELIQQRPLKQSKSAGRAASPAKSAAATIGGAAKTSSRMLHLSLQQQPHLRPTATTKASRSCYLGGIGGLKEAAKSSKRTHHQAPLVQLPRQRLQWEIPRRRQRTSETNASLSEPVSGTDASAAEAQKSGLRRLPVQRQQVPGRASASGPTSLRKSAA